MFPRQRFCSSNRLNGSHVVAVSFFSFPCFCCCYYCFFLSLSASNSIQFKSLDSHFCWCFSAVHRIFIPCRKTQSMILEHATFYILMQLYACDSRLQLFSSLSLLVTVAVSFINSTGALLINLLNGINTNRIVRQEMTATVATAANRAVTQLRFITFCNSNPECFLRG